MDDGKYKAKIGSDGKWYVDGPGEFGWCDYYGGLLYPGGRFNSEECSKDAAIIANVANRAGYRQAQYDIRKALGIKD